MVGVAGNGLGGVQGDVSFPKELWLGERAEGLTHVGRKLGCRCPQPCSPPWCQLLLVALKPMLFGASNAIWGLGATKAQGVGLGAHDLPLSWLLVAQPSRGLV